MGLCLEGKAIAISGADRGIGNGDEHSIRNACIYRIHEGTARIRQLQIAASMPREFAAAN